MSHTTEQRIGALAYGLVGSAGVAQDAGFTQTQFIRAAKECWRVVRGIAENGQERDLNPPSSGSPPTPPNERRE